MSESQTQTDYYVLSATGILLLKRNTTTDLSESAKGSEKIRKKGIKCEALQQ